MKGRFIVLEGIDGSGSTTQTNLLATYLFNRSKSNVIVKTREPTSLNIYGEEIRRRLRNELFPYEELNHDPKFWTELFVNDRKWHLENIVCPAIDKGEQVITDRHMLSTLAYQSTQGMNLNKLIEMHHSFYAPDLTIFLEVPVDIALKRRLNESGNPEYFERLDFQTRLIDSYKAAIEEVREQQKIVTINGNEPIEKVAKEIESLVNPLYGYK